MDNDIEIEKNDSQENEALALSNAIHEISDNPEVSQETQEVVNSQLSETEVQQEKVESQTEEKVEAEIEVQAKEKNEVVVQEETVEAEEKLEENPVREIVVREEKLEEDKPYAPNTESEVMLFLGEELEPLRRTKRVNVYDLETEYAKTRKNKLWSVWIMLALTFAVVVLVTVFTVGGLSASNEHIDVNFSSFKDLDLQNLFNQLQRTQESFDEATKRHAELKGALDSRLAQAKIKFDNDMRLLKNTRLSRSAQRSRDEKIRSDYNAEIRSLHSEYDARISAAEAEVKQYEEQLKSYDSENVARAQEWEQQRDSERQIFQLEKQRLIENYENQLDAARQNLESTRKKDLEDRISVANEITRRYEAEIATYDPIIKDSKTTGLISELENSESQKFDAETLIGSDEGVTENFAYVLREIQVDYDNLEYLYGHSSSIPNRHTMKSVVSAEKKLSAALTNKLAEAAAKEINERTAEVAEMTQQLKDTENQLDFARSAGQAYIEILNKLPVDEKTAGYVLDPNANYGVAIFVRSAVSQNLRQDGSTRVEIYDGRTLLATGAILAVAGNYYISLDNDDAKERISVGNVFRISTKK